MDAHQIGLPKVARLKPVEKQPAFKDWDRSTTRFLFTAVYRTNNR